MVDAPIYVRHTCLLGSAMTLTDLSGPRPWKEANYGYDIHWAMPELGPMHTPDVSLNLLVVIPQTDGIASSEALRLAQKYDTRGKLKVGAVPKFEVRRRMFYVCHISSVQEHIMLTSQFTYYTGPSLIGQQFAGNNSVIYTGVSPRPIDVIGTTNSYRFPLFSLLSALT